MLDLEAVAMLGKVVTFQLDTTSKGLAKCLLNFWAFKRVSNATYWHRKGKLNYSSGLVRWKDHKEEGCQCSSDGLLQLKARRRQTGAFLLTSVTRLSSVGNI